MTRMTRLWPLVLSTVALGINSYVIAGILPSIAVSLRTSQGAVGLGVTAFTAAYALTAPWLPGLLTRTGTTRRALSTALAVFTAGSAITALSPSPRVFLVARAVAGVGAGALTALATGAAGAMMPGRRDRAMATITLGLSLGTVAGVPVGMLIAGRVGWRAAMGLIVVLGLVALAALAARGAAIPDLPRPARSNRSNRPNRPEGTAEGARDPRIPAGRARIRRRTALVLAGGVVLAFLLGVASLGLYTYLLPIAAGAGLSGLGFALVWAWGIGGVAGSWSAGRLLGRIPGRRLLPPPPALLSAVFLLLLLTRAPVAWLAASAVWGAAGWASVAVGQAAFTAVRRERSVQIVARLMAAIYIGSAVGSALGADLLADRPATELPGWALIASGAATAAALILAAALPSADEAG